MESEMTKILIDHIITTHTQSNALKKEISAIASTMAKGRGKEWKNCIPAYGILLVLGAAEAVNFPELQEDEEVDSGTEFPPLFLTTGNHKSSTYNFEKRMDYYLSNRIFSRP